MAVDAPVRRSEFSRGALFRKYAAYLAVAVCLAVLAGGVAAMYVAQRELPIQLAALRREKALLAAREIEFFIQGIRQQMGWITLFPVDRGFAALRLDSERLLRHVTAISHLQVIDGAGRERLFASRFDLGRIDSGLDLSATPQYRAAKAGQVYFGDIYFRRETEPYLSIAEREARPDGGVLVADVNLKAVWNVVTSIRVGESGYAYVVDSAGTLIAHPDISLVLRKTSLRSLPQVAAALAAPSGQAALAFYGLRGVNSDGIDVVSAAVRVGEPPWLVFVEQPVREANAPIDAAMLTTAVLMGGGLFLSLTVAFRFARRMAKPIEALRQGTAQLAEGALGHRINLRSRDELEVVAHQINVMADRLQDSYATLERKIEERTRELELANRTKTRFIAAASHDLRQPVHALGFLFAAMRREKDAGALQAMIERAEAALDMIADLLSRLLDISRLDAGVEQPKLQDFNVAILLDRLAFDFGPEAQSKDVELRVVRSTLVVRSDPVMLARILSNLVSNAIRYTTRGKVLVGCRRTGSAVRIEVHDMGPGIPAEQRGAIFQEFFRGGDADMDRSRGLGLGLAIVKRLADLLHITVDLRSTPGRGSVFAVTVATGAESRPVVAPSGPSPNLVDGGMSGRRVLVIDDNQAIVDLMRQYLLNWGCDVVGVVSAKAAFEHLGSGTWRPDIIICDYDLRTPETGIDVLGRLRAHLGEPVPGILMTADTTPVVFRQAEAAGFPVAHKPVRPASLRSLIAHLLSARAEAAGKQGHGA